VRPAAPRTWRERLPASALGWVQLATGILGVLVVLSAIAYALWPILAHAHGYGRHDWDRMESHRYLVRKAIDGFHEVPWWNPYTCGGHPAWGGMESDTVVVAPWLPAYLLLSLPVAMRVEIVACTLWGALGAWLLASRFTRSPAARALVAVVFAVSSRWTFQLAAGHAWHMVYAWMPWVLLLFDRAVGTQPELGPPRPRAAVWAGACLAMMVYTGGVYPLPHTVVALALYAALLSVMTRSARPLGVLALTWVVALGLAAPKLLPILEPGRGAFVALDSTDALNPHQIMNALINPAQTYGVAPEGIYDSAWQDVGMYLGWPALLLLGAGVLLGRGPRAQALKVVGGVFVVLGLGSFAHDAPWVLVHRLPVFASQRVASVWLYPALLLLACAAAAAAERTVARSGRARAAIEIGLTLALLWIARDVARAARQPLLDQLQSDGPKTAESTAPFRTESRLPSNLAYQVGEPGPSSLSAEMANVGTIECNTFDDTANYSGLQIRTPPYEGRSATIGARGVGESGYHGEVYLAESRGTARFVRWSPSAFDVQVDGAQPGELVVVNQNWDPGWRVDGARTIDHDQTIAAPVSATSQTLSFRYRPRTLWAGIGLFVLTIAALAGRVWRRAGGVWKRYSRAG
jgi:hypothetical protein